MKSNSIRGILFITLLIIFAKLSNITINPILLVLFFALYITAIWLLSSWKTFGSKWVCDKCGEECETSMINNMKSIFLHLIKNKIQYRYLYCNKCKKENWFCCIVKEN